jgi:glutamine synthetase
MAKTATPRYDTLAAATKWDTSKANGRMDRRNVPPPMDIEKIFGENTFGLAEMRARLPKQIYRALIATIEKGQELDASVADAVALAM